METTAVIPAKFCTTIKTISETKKKRKRQKTQTVANWVFAQTTHVVRSKYSFAWWVVFGW